MHRHIDFRKAGMCAVVLVGFLLSHPQPSLAQEGVPAQTAAAPVAAPTAKRSLQDNIIEGYAAPDYREMIQTIIVLGTYDINKTDVLDEYTKLIECSAYKKLYTDDFAWNEVRKKVQQRVLNQKESYRIFYEYSGLIRLDEYNFSGQHFPLTRQTRFDNVGNMEVITTQMSNPVQCRTGDREHDKTLKPFFPTVIGLQLNTPLSMTRINMTPERAEALLTKLKARGVTDRSVFVRFRFRVVDQPRLVKNSKGEAWRADLVGHLEKIDFFLDRDLTMWIASYPLG